MYCLEDAFCNQSGKCRWSSTTEYYSVAVCFWWSLPQCCLSNIFFWTYCLSWFNNPFVWKPKRKKQQQACKAPSINLSLMFTRKEMWKDQDILISLSIIRSFKNRLYTWIKKWCAKCGKTAQSTANCTTSVYLTKPATKSQVF